MIMMILIVIVITRFALKKRKDCVRKPIAAIILEFGIFIFCSLIFICTVYLNQVIFFIVSVNHISNKTIRITLGQSQFSVFKKGNSELINKFTIMSMRFSGPKLNY